jgi:hypothetical protein
MSEILTRLNIESAPHNNLIEFIDDRSIIKDPRNPNSNQTLRQFVYDTDPLMKSINFSYFPYIIVKAPSILYSRLSSNGKVKHLEFAHLIIVRTLKDGSSNVRADVGRLDLQSIANSLQLLFNTESYKQQFRDLNMRDLILEKSASDESIVIQMRPILEQTYRLTYNTRLTVSN